MDFCAGTYFFFSPSLPCTNVRLERELIYDSQFDERPRGRKKRSFFSENEHQRLGEKRKQGRGGDGGSEKTTRETAARGSKSTADKRAGEGRRRDKTARSFSMESGIDDTRFTSLRDADVTQRDAGAECLHKFKCKMHIACRCRARRSV